MTDPPALPGRLSRMSTVVGVGTTLWATGALVALIAHLVADRPLDTWFSTCVTGALLGGVGWGIFTWQRAAARRGRRGAQTGVE
ncbi:MAG: DUF2530 domain-containing protein [Pseudonocardia sp.]